MITRIFNAMFDRIFAPLDRIAEREVEASGRVIDDQIRAEAQRRSEAGLQK